MRSYQRCQAPRAGHWLRAVAARFAVAFAIVVAAPFAVFVATAFTAAFAAAFAPAAFADDSAFTSTAGVGSIGGAEIYSHICQGCHMPEGVGAVGAGHYPKLAGDPALTSWQYAALTVLNGRHAMPPFGLPADEVQEIRTVHLSDTQIADVVNYIRSHFGNTYADQATTAQVAALPHPSSPAPP
jgi:mono/diheme cytochrome c family protein